MTVHFFQQHLQQISKPVFCAMGACVCCPSGSAPLSFHSVTQSKAWLRLLGSWQQLTIFIGFTFIAAFLVLSAAAAYIRFVIRPKILRRLICAAVIAVMIPLFPMVMAYAGGTPLQASLYWGMEVMGIEGEEGTEETEVTES